MTAFDRRRFLLATAAVGIGAGVGAARDSAAPSGWEFLYRDGVDSSFADARRTEDGYLLSGSVRDDSFLVEGAAVELTADGRSEWDRRYRSPAQEAGREREGLGPIPEDHLSFALETADGYLLVGWTYYDNTAVDVARVYRVDADGAVRESHDLGELDGASAFSRLNDGVPTDDGFLCCGIESPGISLGGAGWLVSLAPDGSVTRHRRYPATERNLERTTRRDVFNAIEPADEGYALGGACELEDGDPAHAWVVGLDADGNVRWDDRFRLEAEGPTVVHDVEPSDGDAYDFLVVGATGWDAMDLAGRDAIPTGQGFVAAYTADGDRRWLETLEDTPLFCAARGSRGVVAGGARDGRGWVGTVGRTDFEADRESVVASLAEARGGGVVCAGRAADGDRTRGWARVVPDGGTTDEREDDPADDAAGDADPVAFLDCHRARVTGEYDDVILAVTYVAEDGMIGTITEPVGAVDGERVVDAAAEFGLEPDATVLASVELFEDVAVATPGLGDRRVENPNLEACRRERLDGADASGGK